jgi:hypothetical protein
MELARDVLVIAHLKLGHSFADRLDCPSHVTDMDAGRAHADEHVTVTDFN